MLNPDWSKHTYDKDLALWKKIIYGWESYYKYKVEDFFDDYEKEISYLYDTYYRTNDGWNADPNKAIRQKFFILKKDNTMGQLRESVKNEDIQINNDWNENQIRDESLDARLEREKGEYESRESSLKLSKRE